MRETMNGRKCSGKKFILAAAVLAGIYGVMNVLAGKKTESEKINEGNPYKEGQTSIHRAEERKTGNRAAEEGSGEEWRIRGESKKKDILQRDSGYEKYVKGFIDKGLSFVGMVILAPVYGILALAIMIDDPGPVLFTQKRIGKNKQFFMLHKFRSMKMSTPHDVPTHQLKDPEQYITRVGKFLRKYSLDELPQIWDIFRGKMSIIGPRPALWNQDDLVAERDKYGANGILPGLTGWAQINGRDELEIADKAKLDGEYAEKLKQGGMKALFFDVKCFLGTVVSVIGSDGVVEGGTGELLRTVEKASETGNRRSLKEICTKHGNKRPITVKKDIVNEAVSEADAGFEDYGHLKHFDIDTSENNKKRVLITGAGSYIGESFEKWAEQYYSVHFTIDTVDMQSPDWRERDFSAYDTVFHVAGIAHADVGRVSEEEKKKYYAVNTDLAVETAKKAKEEGVRQFILMSSMIIYGDSAPCGKEKVIEEHTLPAPANFYGDSKWQADKGVRALAEEDFRVAVLRPPMIYGRGSKGNYQILAKLAKRLPVFPDVENRRSMLYIDNLCEFLCKLMLSGEGGVYFPQNGEYTKTSEMVRLIAEVAGRRIWVTKVFRPVVMAGRWMPGKVSGLVNKAFGNCVYEQRLSEYKGLEYRICSVEKSIEKTEGADTVLNFNCIKRRDSGVCDTEGIKPHILVVSQYFYPEIFRINDIASEWVKRGYRVTVLAGIPNYPMGKFFEGYGYCSRRREQWNGIDIIRIPIVPRGNSKNKILNGAGMVANYISFVASGWWWKMVNDINADIAFTYEVSPMTQALVGVWYAKKHHIPHFLYVQDLWPENVEAVAGIKSRIVIALINRMVDYIYRNTDQIFVTSGAFADAIVNRDVKVASDKVHYWPQYAEEFYRPLKREEARKTAGRDSPVWFIPNDDSFKIVFTGNIGTAQGLDILPKAAAELNDCRNEKKVKFIIVGDGRYLKDFEGEIRKWRTEGNFIIIPRQKAEEIPKLLACCDAAFLSFSDTELWKKTIPAKLQSYMACGIPIIAAVAGETKLIIEKAKCGICCGIGNSRELLLGIQKIANLTVNERKTMGENGRAYFKKNFDKKFLMDVMDQYIRDEGINS